MKYFIYIIFILLVSCKTNDLHLVYARQDIPNLSITKINQKPPEEWLWLLPKISIDHRIIEICIKDYIKSTGHRASCTDVLGEKNGKYIYIIITDEVLLDKVKAYQYDKKRRHITCKFNVPVT